MKQNGITADFLRGTGASVCTLLFAAAAFIGKNILIGEFTAAAVLYLSIKLLRTPDKASLKRRSLISLFMFFPLACLIGVLLLSQRVGFAFSPYFADMCALIVLYLPGACLLRMAASIYAGTQKKHPVIPIILLYLLYAVRLTDSFYFLFREELPSDLHFYSGFVRELFFEFCALAVFHLILVFVLNRSIRQGSAHPKRMKAFAAVLCGYTVFAAAASLAALHVYISAGGMTAMRRNAVWVTAVIAAVYMVLFIYQLAAGFSGRSGQASMMKQAG